MKQFLVAMMSLGITLGASAQHGVRGSVRNYGQTHTSVKPKVIVVAPAYGSLYGPRFGNGFGYAPLGYAPFGYPYYQAPFPIERRPSELDLQVEGIKNDYSHEISSVRHNKLLGRDERNQKIRDLKHEREELIIDAKKSYYKPADKN